MIFENAERLYKIITISRRYEFCDLDCLGNIIVMLIRALKPKKITSVTLNGRN